MVVYLDELRPEIQTDFDRLRKAWLAQHHDDTTETKPTAHTAELMREARHNVVQKYLDQATITCWAARDFYLDELQL